MRRFAFRYEKQMLDLSAEFLPAILEPKFPNQFSTPELYLQGVIPDLVLVSWNEIALPLTRRVTTIEAHVLHALRTQAETAHQIAQKLVFSNARMDKTVSSLQKLGLIEVSCTGVLKLTDAGTTEAAEIIAIEMKMRDWRKALAQAREYTAFADRAYVILDGFQVERSATMDGHFSEAGIGLIFQHGYQLEPIIDARAVAPASPLRFIALQKLMLERQRCIKVAQSRATY
jgi:hypothetical protein